MLDSKTMKPMCVKCQRFLRPFKNGVRILEGKPIAQFAKPGTEDADLWAPYKVWTADLWKCEGCGIEIVTGYGHYPLWQDYYGEMPEGNYLRVNDC